MNKISKMTKGGSILFRQNMNAHKLEVAKVDKSTYTNSLFWKYQASVALMASNMLYKKMTDSFNAKPAKPKTIEPNDTVILYQFPRSYYSPSLSPFALKLETWCRAAGVKYQNKFGLERGAKGLIPFIKLNDHVVDDSQRCIEYLTEILEKDINSHLTDEQCIMSRLVIKLVDDSLKWNMAMHRFVHNPNGMTDNMLPRIAMWNFGYRVKTAASYAGYGLLSKNELFDHAKKDMQAIENLIGEKIYLFSNDKPSVADFAIFGLFVQLIFNDTGVLNQFIKAECPNIMSHTSNIKAIYWKDWDDHTIKGKIMKKKLNSKL